MFILGHQESDFQCPFFAFESKKADLMNYTNIVTHKRQNKLSEQMSWSLVHCLNRQFSLTVVGINGMKTL